MAQAFATPTGPLFPPGYSHTAAAGLIMRAAAGILAGNALPLTVQTIALQPTAIPDFEAIREMSVNAASWAAWAAWEACQ